MTLFLKAAALAALALPAAPAPLPAAPAKEPRRAAPAVPIFSVLSDEDYPDEAIRAGEQGAVSFRLSIDPAGRVSGCEVTASSGSASLDSTTCRLMKERASFRPAADPSGKPVAEVYDGRLTWKLPDAPSATIDIPERPSAAIRRWLGCVDEEAARLTLPNTDAASIVERAFQGCSALEADAVRQLKDARIAGLDAERSARALRDDAAARLTASISGRSGR